MSDVLFDLRRVLAGRPPDRPGILDREGRVLMSGQDTIRPGDYYVVGLNPGGRVEVDTNPDLTIGASLRQHPANWNYFSSDEAGKKHSKYVLPVFDNLGAGPPTTLTTNACFVRSPTEATLPDDIDLLWDHYFKPAHELLISHVSPRVVVCFGIGAWKLLTGRGDPGRWGFFPDVPQLGTPRRPYGMLLLPHFADRLGTWESKADLLLQAQTEAKHAVGAA